MNMPQKSFSPKFIPPTILLLAMLCAMCGCAQYRYYRFVKGYEGMRNMLEAAERDEGVESLSDFWKGAYKSMEHKALQILKMERERKKEKPKIRF